MNKSNFALNPVLISLIVFGGFGLAGSGVEPIHKSDTFLAGSMEKESVR